MFDTKTSISERFADAVDLLIDLATLGEYGLEPAARPAPACESRLRPLPSQAGTKRGAPVASSLVRR
jgi:hypothetical protein